MASFRMRLDEIQPSQLYINRAKLEIVMRMIESGQASSLGPIPIKELDGEIISTDGHTRAWCKEEGIRTIANLADRIIDSAEYQVLWLERCRKMQQELEEGRRREEPD
jgi:hypothetical protein